MKTKSFFMPARQVFQEAGNNALPVPEGEKKPKEAPKSAENREFLQKEGQKLYQDIINAAGNGMKDSDPKIRMIAKQAMQDADQVAAVLEMGRKGNVVTSRIDATKPGDEYVITAKYEGDLTASIQQLKDILEMFEVNRIKAVGVTEAGEQAETRAQDKEDGLKKIIKAVSDSYPELKNNMNELNLDVTNKFIEIRAVLTEELKSLDVKKQEDLQKANNAIQKADSEGNKVVAEARLTLDPIFEAGNLIGESRDFKKGLDYARAVFNEVKLNAPSSKTDRLEGIIALFESEYAMLKANTPENAKRRAMLIANVLDDVRRFKEEKTPPKFTNLDLVQRMSRYKGDDAENAIRAENKAASDREKGSTVQLRIASALRSAGYMEGMNLTNIPSGAVVEFAGEKCQVQLPGGKKAEYEKVIYKTKDGKQVEGWIDSRSVPPAKPPGKEK